ncbi:uncharacterized protein LOC119100218 [Pollicipes pollicipes]|uniref:uncharacterized protein LOC119100218 n=1 Tax=Pollicipes pollicipes TaxID=41117 RepID=UPI0018853243|nr:uncharacterized protein LOC119100218 [Pollicipes pollicipes]
MRLIAAALLVVLVSSATIRKPLPYPSRQTLDAEKNVRGVLDTVRLIESRMRSLKTQKQDQTVSRLHGLIAAAEWQAHTLLQQHGSAEAAQALVTAAHEAAQGLRALAAGTTDVEAGLHAVLSEVLVVLHQLGAVQDGEQLDVTTPMSFLDKILEELQSLVDKYLPILGPIIGLTEKQALEARKQFDKFVADVEALEHGQVPTTDGLEAMITDILEILKILGIDYNAPTDDTPTALDGLLAQLESALDTVLGLLGPILGLTDDQIKAAEHGDVDVDGGLETVLMDLVKILHEFGIQTSLSFDVQGTTAPSVIDLILEELKHVVDTYMPIIGPAIGITKEEYESIITNFDKFVADIEGMEHGTIEIADGVIDICTDILHVLEAFGVDATVPSTDAPTTLDEVLFWLEEALNAVLDIVGVFMGLDYDQTKQVEADLHVLMADIRALGDGQIDVDGGLEAILLDILKILGDFGIPTDHLASSDSTDPTPVDKILEELRAIVDKYLPILGPIIGLTQEQVDAVVSNFDKFVADVEALEHGTVDISTGIESMVTDIIEILRALGIDHTNPTDDTPTGLDGLLTKLEGLLDKLLESLGPVLGLTDDQIKAAEADIDTLIKDIESAEHGHTDIDTALEKILTDVLNILKDCGAPILSTADPSPIDKILEQLQALVDKYLPILGPIIGLTQEQVDAVVSNFDKFVADVEALEHGTVDISTGIESMVTDIIEILRALGIDHTNPTDDTPTGLDGLLTKLEGLLDKLLESLGPVLGLTDDQIKAAEADIDTLIKDIESAEHGHTDIDTALEKILTDVLNILKDCGAPILSTADPSPIDKILEQLQALVDKYLPILGPIIGLTQEQVDAVVSNFDKFVADVEALEHGTVDISTGIESMVTDMIEILKADDTPTGLDGLLTKLEGLLDKLLESLGPVLADPSPIDKILEQLQALVDKYLPILGPIIGLTQEQVDAVVSNFDKFVADVEALEHGTVDISTGIESMVTDIIEILRALGIDHTNPTDDTPTGLDGLLTKLEGLLDKLLESLGPVLADPSPIDKILEQLQALVDKYLPILGPIIGLTQEQVDAVVSNFDKFVADVEALEHGTVDISTGIESMVTDMIEILKALGIDHTNPSEY